LTASPWETWRKERYASFDQGAGLDFANGKTTLASLRDLAAQAAEPQQRSGRQEAYENLFNLHLSR
jgi:xylose isomerase